MLQAQSLVNNNNNNNNSNTVNCIQQVLPLFLKQNKKIKVIQWVRNPQKQEILNFCLICPALGWVNRTVVCNLFGTMVSGWFKHIYYTAADLTGGGAQGVMWEMGGGWKHRWGFACLLASHLLRCSPAPNLEASKELHNINQLICYKLKIYKLTRLRSLTEIRVE